MPPTAVDWTSATLPNKAALPPANPSNARAQPAEPVIDAGMNRPATISTSPSTMTAPIPAKSPRGRI